MTRTIATAALAFATLTSTAALAQDDPPAAGAPAQEPLPPEPTLPPPDATVPAMTPLPESEPEPKDEFPVLGPMPTEDYIREVNATARGVGFGFGMGLWGASFAQSLRIDVPFGFDYGQFFGVRIQGLIAYGPFDASSFDPVIMAGIEPFGRSPVILGVARVYGGGGVHFGGQPNPAPGTTEDSFGVSGGGHMGIEIFGQPWMGYSIEVGGQGGLHDNGFDGGASVMGGMTFYVGGN